jgi:predicted dehydrogenase
MFVKDATTEDGTPRSELCLPRNQLRVLVIGIGSAGSRHLRNLHFLGHTEFHALRSQPGASHSELGGVKLRNHYDLSSALAEQPDIAVIANPTSLHIPIALAAAEKGCHLFLEKPVSSTLDGIDRLVAMVRKQKLVAAVGYNLRFHPALRALREILQRGEIGDVISVRSWVGQYLPDWHPGEDYRESYIAKPSLGGGVILTLSHELDCLFWLFGDVAEVTAVTGRARNLQMETESLAEITLSFCSGVLGHVHLDCVQRTPQRGLELIGTEGTILLNLRDSTIHVSRSSSRVPEVIEIPRPDPNQMYLDEMTDFLAAIEKGKQPRVPLEDGVAVLKIALAAHRAAETGIRQQCV